MQYSNSLKRAEKIGKTNEINGVCIAATATILKNSKTSALAKTYRNISGSKRAIEKRGECEGKSENDRAEQGWRSQPTIRTN